MGGMDNKTSIEIARARYKSKTYYSEKNSALYKEYINSDSQFSKTFVEWKKEKFKNKKSQKQKQEKMQKPLSKKELKKRGYITKSLNQLIRWK